MIEAVTAGLRGKARRIAFRPPGRCPGVVGGESPVVLPRDAVLWGGEPAPLRRPSGRSFPFGRRRDDARVDVQCAAPTPDLRAAPSQTPQRTRSWAPWLELGSDRRAFVLVLWRMLATPDPAPAPQVAVPEVLAEAAPHGAGTPVVAEAPPPEAKPATVAREAPGGNPRHRSSR